MMHKEFTILEDIVVHSVPDGIRTTLEKGKSGIIHNLWETIIL